MKVYSRYPFPHTLLKVDNRFNKFPFLRVSQHIHIGRISLLSRQPITFLSNSQSIHQCFTAKSQSQDYGWVMEFPVIAHVYQLRRLHIKDDNSSFWLKLIDVMSISALSVLNSMTIPLSVVGLKAI